MTFDMLVNQFIQVKQVSPSNVDELLDFTSRGYIQGELSLAQYHHLFRVLNDQGAKKPDYLHD